MATSAGLLMFRRCGDVPEVLLVHPGGPFWTKRARVGAEAPRNFRGKLRGDRLARSAWAPLRGPERSFGATRDRFGPGASDQGLTSGGEDGEAERGSPDVSALRRRA